MIYALILGVILSVQQGYSPDHLTITKEGKNLMNINRLDFTVPHTDLPIINSKKYNLFLDNLNTRVAVEPKNAIINQSDQIISEKVGYQIHRSAFTEKFYRYFFSGKQSSIEIPMQMIHPKVDSELLEEIRNERIGRYLTTFSPQNKNRTTNIQLAANAIDNHVVFPGEIFSFNKVVGKRTKERGYLRAKVIVKGEFSEDIGGGICQVSSTLFNAVDNAGLKITERFSHSRSVHYIPPGRDATVSWYGPDFKFKNMYNQPVLIRAKTMGHLLIIKLYSSESIEYKPRKVPFSS